MSRSRSALILAILIGLSGCVTTETALRPYFGPPPEAVQQVHAAWENRVVKTQDVVNGGQDLLGVAGRIYLFGEKWGVPMQGRGAAIIELADASQPDAKGKMKLLERFEIDPATLSRLGKKDMLGWGYTVFLPWSTYRPEITRVQLQVKWVPEKGQPLYSPPALVSLNHEEAQVSVTQRRVAASELQNTGFSAPPPPTPPQATRQP